MIITQHHMDEGVSLQKIEEFRILCLRLSHLMLQRGIFPCYNRNSV